MSKVFYNDATLIEYEKHAQWDKCVTHLTRLMHLYPQDKGILYRLAAQCWYILTFWDCNMPKEKLDRTVFESNLKNAYVIAQKKWWDDSDCLWLFGYFMCINQMDFPYVSTDFREVELEGYRLILTAYLNDPNNSLAKVLHLADSRKKYKYTVAVKKLKNRIGDYFSNLSSIDRYFSEIFTNTY